MATTATNTNTAPTAPPAFQLIERDKLVPDMAQPRKSFDEAELQELAVSIQAHGIVVALKVRPNAKKAGTYMIVHGERRWRAAEIAGLKLIPCVVEDLDDAKTLEQQIIENSQRADVPPLEEAEAYSVLMKKHGFTMDRLIERTGRSKAHLYGRLKLLELAPGAKKALQSGKLQSAIAELIARIPDHKLQEQATKDCLGVGEGYSWNTVQPEKIGDENERQQAQPLSFRAALQLLRRRYQTRFDLTRFDPMDKTLLPKVGSCDGCPHRSGNQPALPGITPAKSVDEDYCTNAPCFESKVDATFKMKADLAKSKGLKVIEGPAAKKILNTYDGDVSYDANYADPKAQLPYNIAKPGSTATWGGLLGKKLEEVPRVVVQDPNTGAARELLVKDKAVEVLRELGKIDKADKASKSSAAADAKAKAERKKELAKKHMTEETVTRVLAKVAEATAAQDVEGKKLLAQIRWLARAAIRDYNQAGGDGGTAVLERRGLDNYDDLEDLVVKAKTLGEVLAPVVELYISIHSEERTRTWATSKDGRDFFDEGCKLFGADWDKAAAAAKEAAKVEAKSDAAKEKKAAPATAKKGGGK